MWKNLFDVIQSERNLRNKVESLTGLTSLGGLAGNIKQKTKIKKQKWYDLTNWNKEDIKWDSELVSTSRRF